MFVPESRDGRGGHDVEIGWENLGLEMADVILFWVPAAPEPGSTSVGDLELGAWAASGKVVYGAAEGVAAHPRLAAVVAGNGIEVHRDLDAAVAAAVAALGPPADRRSADRLVPLPIWRSASFQAWRTTLVEAGHTIDDIRILWSYPGSAGVEPFAWVSHPDIAVAGEGRAKTNEIVATRPDISSVCAWARNDLGVVEVVLVREFRSTYGHVLELPGGSSDHLRDPLRVAVAEFAGEVGLTVDPARLVAHGARRCAGTFNTHAGHLFSLELTADELEQLRGDHDVHGVDDSERTTVVVVALDELVDLAAVDWTTIGMVRQVLAG